MRIVLTTPYSWPEVRRGAERYAHELAAALSARGHRVTIWSTARHPGTDKVLGVEVRRLPQRRLQPARWKDQAAEVGFAAQVLPRLATRRLDVWHATGIADATAATMLGRLRPGLTTVFTDHGFPVASSKARRSDAGLHRRVVDRIGTYICVSSAAGDYLQRDFGRPAVVVPPGVDLDRYRAGRRETRPTLLFSGQLDEPRKHLPLFLAAIDLLIARLPDLQIWLLGQGDADAALQAVSPAARAAVTRCAAVDDEELRARYAAAWLTVLPSVAESFGLVVVESLASGTPVVVRRDSGGPAQLITDPEVGICSGPTAAELAESIEAGLDLAGRPATPERCRSAAAPYDWRHVAARMEAVYASH